MQVYLESTDRVVTLKAKDGTGEIQARVWQGKTDSDIPVVALIARIAVPEGQPQEEFRRELKEHAAPSPDAVRAFSLRMII